MTKERNTKIGSVYPFLDARTPMANSELLPVKISVILRGKQFRIGVNLYTTHEIFNKAMTSREPFLRMPKDLAWRSVPLRHVGSKSPDLRKQQTTSLGATPPSIIQPQISAVHIGGHAAGKDELVVLGVVEAYVGVVVVVAGGLYVHFYLG